MEKKSLMIVVFIGIILLIIGGYFGYGYVKYKRSSSADINAEVKSEIESLFNQNEQDMPAENGNASTIEAETKPESQVREFEVVAKRWNFDPKIITVNEGDKVILNVKSLDVTHGFSIQNFGVSETLNPGKTTKIEFIADKKGTFTFFCNVYCGSGHSGMSGTLIVN